MSSNITNSLKQTVDALKQGEIIAYPTEAIYGLGCDPDNEQAVKKLLQLKQRPWQKGLILVAANYQQLLPYIDTKRLDKTLLTSIKASWPAPLTWILPALPTVSRWLTGDTYSIAVRVSAHPDVKKICTAFGKALISTSANINQQPPCHTAIEVRKQFGKQIKILEGSIGKNPRPSEIRDGLTGKIIRKG